MGVQLYQREILLGKAYGRAPQSLRPAGGALSRNKLVHNRGRVGIEAVCPLVC